MPVSRLLYRQFTFEAAHRDDVAPLIAAVGNLLTSVQILEAAEQGDGVVVHLKAGMTLAELETLIQPLAGADRMLQTVCYAGRTSAAG